MGQPVSQQLRPHVVTNHMTALAQAQKSVIRDMTDVIEATMEAACLYGGVGASEKVAALRAELESLVQTKHDMESYCLALEGLVSSYSPLPTEETDFASTITSAMQQIVGRSSFAQEKAKFMKDFDNEAAPDDTAGGGEQDLGDDEDIMVTGDDLLNGTCPFTGKQVIELKDPVEDEKGYIYERSAILAHIQQQGRGQGWCDAPFPGANHRVFAHTLKPSSKVLRQQRRRRLGIGTQQAGTQRPGGGNAEVIDV